MWKRFEAKERYKELDVNHIPSLMKEIDELRLGKSEIAAELEKMETLLRTHMDIEEQKEIIYDAEYNKLELQIKAANGRIDELTKHAEQKTKTYREGMLKAGISYRPYDEGASEFSEMSESRSEMDLPDINTLDVLVRNCELDELVLRKILTGKITELDDIQTMLAVDFYNHDTQHSDICEGLRPNYNFQVAYKVTVDAQLISYMEHEHLRVNIVLV